jgi:hypothetical protein
LLNFRFFLMVTTMDDGSGTSTFSANPSEYEPSAACVSQLHRTGYAWM